MVLDMGIANYNNECRSIVQRYTKEWEKTVTRLGRWIDFDNDYKTMDPEYMESVWWVFKTMFDKGLVYRGFKVMPYSATCGCVLSNFEAGLNYKDVDDPACTVSFPLESDPNVNLVAWTTTPWTLPSNLSLCVNESFDYIKIIDKTRDNKVFILLEKRLCQLFPELNKKDFKEKKRAELYEVVEKMKGKALVGLKYKPLFDYYSDITTAFRVISDNYVTEEGGTGIVHQAPAFGEDDYRVCIANGIVEKGETLPCPVDANGRFEDIVAEWKGLFVKDADPGICAHLKAIGRLVMKEVYRHSYPFCWRSDTPLIYKAVPSWFVSVEKIKEKLIQNNKETRWVPAFVQEKRFHNWLADAKDWAISRNRFWGTPIPLWISDDLEEIVAIGSVEELFQRSGVRVSDLHKDHIDHITIPSKEGRGDLKRIDEVFDCWFESGSMPYAQLHYPFENVERFERGFPADFIAEGLDQTRGWFYTLMVISTCLFDKPAFKNLIVNGLVLAADGKKMSKRLNNYPDPMHVLTKYGADSLRLYLINSPVVRADTLKFTEDGVNDVVRGVFLPWYNAFRFFIQCVENYENITQSTFIPNVNISKSSTNDVDVWILASSLGLVKYVHQEMQAYRLYTVVPRLVGFIEELTNWYVRLNRERLKGAMGVEESVLGLNVLFEVLVIVTLIMSPITPFFSEYLYQHLRKLMPDYKNTDSSVPMDTIGKSDSVHYLMLPTVDESRLDPRAESRFKTLQVAVTLSRIARERRHIRSNLPLKNVIVIAANEEDVEALNYLQSYFKSEVNAWKVESTTEWDKLCKLNVIPNFKSLGQRCGKDMKNVSKAINELPVADVVNFMTVGKMVVLGYELTHEDLVVKREFIGDNKQYEAAVSDDGSLMIVIDTTCDEEILAELRARQIAASVQKLRKSSGLVITDKVEIFYEDTQDAFGGLLSASLVSHYDLTMKRIKTIPLPMSLRSKYCSNVASEIINDDEISKNTINLVLTAQCAAVDHVAVRLILAASSSDANVDLITMYVQTMDYERVMSSATLEVVLEDNTKITLTRDVHYFSSVLEMVCRGSKSIRDSYPHLPTSFN